MVSFTRRATLGLATSSLVGAFAVTALAQTDYPSRQVRIIVPSSPGGGTDTVSRLLAQYFSDALGQQFFVDNRPGGGTANGTEAAARSAPDGYTLVTVASTMTSLHVARKVRRFDAVKDFAPITQVVTIPNVLVVHPSVEAKTFGELVALAKKEPGKLSFASPGLASNGHMGMEMLKMRTGIEMLHVPYNGVAPALTDLLAGRVQVMLVNAASAKQHIDSGALRALAVASSKRARALPAVPTISESGLPNYEVNQWFGLLASAGTPAAITHKLQREVVAMLKTPTAVKWMDTEGAEPVGSTPEEFGKLIADDVARWDEVAKAARITPQ
jgi:tripartite-type tricarboxylate transporter receptor subunit TctC